jgi:hypothetical protein
MTRLKLGPTFERVIIPHSGLWCLCDEASVRACLRGVRQALHKNGKLVLDAYAADAFHAECTPEDQSDEHRDEVTRIQLGERSYRVYEQSRWDKDRQTIVATYAYVNEQTGKEQLETITQRYLLLPQLESLLESEGFVLEHVGGDFAGAAYDDESDVLTVEARVLR